MADNKHIKQQSSLGPLGQETEYVAQYDPAQLCPIPRSKNWQNQGFQGRGFQSMPFGGCDIRNAYEISWLNAKGLPRVAVGEFRFPCDSANIIESKSFKLYLNSYNMTRFDSQAQVVETMKKDLSACAGAQVTVVLRSLTDAPCAGVLVERFEGTCIDNLDIDIEQYQPAPERLTADTSQIVEERLHSHLLKSNCPVTGQPDWASIEIQYQGPKIDHEGLLAYLVSYRERGDFHEDCVEQIFTDILSHCQPEELSVYARYVRRGGLDINPYRSTCYRTETSAQPKNVRLARQ